MRVRGKVAAFAGALALVSGLVVTSLPASATVTHVGDCAGGSRAIGKILPGLTKAKVSNTITVKGIPSDANGDGVSDGPTSFGSCTFTGGPGAGTHAVSGFSAKVVGTTSCTPGLASSTSDVIPSGKITWKFTDTTQTAVYGSITGFKPSTTNVVQIHGIVTKGNGLGSFLTAENAFLPVVKVKFPGALNLWNDGVKTEYDLDVSSECAGGTAGVPLTQILVSTGGASGAAAPSFDLGSVALS
jgi:hypothetical protein